LRNDADYDDSTKRQDDVKGSRHVTIMNCESDNCRDLAFEALTILAAEEKK
jgi:hypothetical protein